MLTAVGIVVIVVLVATIVLQWRRTRDLEARLGRANEDLEDLQHAFARFAPATVVDEIASQGVSLRPEAKEVTVLFADLRGFTTIAEGLDPAVLVTMLNGYFVCMERAITAHRGHLAKFIGDGLLALFGALESNPWQTNDALHAALAMRAALDEYNRDLRRQGLPALAVGIGIHRGPVVAGVLGASAVQEYGVIGSTVNVASRVERLTRVHHADVLVTDAVRTQADPRFVLREMPVVPIKGIPTVVTTFAVERFADPID